MKHTTGVTPAFGQRREDNHADWVAGGQLALVPGDENRAVIGEGGRVQEFRQLLREPPVALTGEAGAAGGQAMHIVGNVWGNEIVAANAIGREIRRKT